MTPGGRAAPAAAAILCLATALAYGALGPGAAPSPDFQRAYLPVAERIVAGAGPTLEDGSPAVRYPPGYPALLAGGLAAGRALGASDGA
ncbi:MAG TPA: hypothetical protein VM778_03000, partial [Gemmatimonadota bacterium]|nr:hypothetical protein [Gemmatimonadota bacterium]